MMRPNCNCTEVNPGLISLFPFCDMTSTTVHTPETDFFSCWCCAKKACPVKILLRLLCKLHICKFGLCSKRQELARENDLCVCPVPYPASSLNYVQISPVAWFWCGRWCTTRLCTGYVTCILTQKWLQNAGGDSPLWCLHGVRPVLFGGKLVLSTLWFGVRRVLSVAGACRYCVFQQQLG